MDQSESHHSTFLRASIQHQASRIQYPILRPCLSHYARCPLRYAFLTRNPLLYPTSIFQNKRPEQPVSRILFPDRVTPHRATIIHLRMPVARHLLRPTRKLGRATLDRFPIWSCTGWGLPSFPGHPENWCALTAPFHPYPDSVRAVYFLLHFPSCRHDFTL